MRCFDINYKLITKFIVCLTALHSTSEWLCVARRLRRNFGRSCRPQHHIAISCWKQSSAQFCERGWNLDTSSVDRHNLNLGSNFHYVRLHNSMLRKLSMHWLRKWYFKAKMTVSRKLSRLSRASISLRDALWIQLLLHLTENMFPQFYVLGSMDSADEILAVHRLSIGQRRLVPLTVAQ